MTLGEKLVILRKKNSLSQDELASAIRVSRQTVYKWESGKSAPDANNLIALKATFGISIDNLLDESYIEEAPEKKKRKRAPAVAKEKTESPVIVEEVVSSVAEEPVKAESLSVSQTKETVNEEYSAVKEEKPAEAEKKVEEKPVEDKKIGFFGRLFGRK